MIRPVALSVFAAALALAGCVSSPGRPGPVVDVTAPAPFLSTHGIYPTQAEAQAAVDLAVQQHGLAAVYSRFGAIAPDRVPTFVALFACKPGFYRPSVNAVEARRGFVHCHVDVMDQAYGLLGRSTMSFYRQGGLWVLASAREREVDAR